MSEIEETNKETTDEMPVCPICGKNDMVKEIIYGYPSSDILEKVVSGNVILGGCVIQAERYFCERDQKNFE